MVQPEIGTADKRPMLETLVSASQQKKDYPRLVKWARQYLQEGGSNVSMRTVMIQVLAVTGQHAEVVKEMQEKMRLDEVAGKKTAEEELRMLAVSYRNLKDNAGYQSTLRQLLTAYPSKGYWSETISRLAQAPGLNQRLELDLYRLLEESGNLEEADEFEFGWAVGVMTPAKDSDVPGAMEYFAGLVIEEMPEYHPGLQKLEVPAGLFSVCEHIGSVDELGETTQWFYSDYLPGSGAKWREAAHLEVYDERFDPESDHSVVMICAPIEC